MKLNNVKVAVKAKKKIILSFYFGFKQYILYIVYIDANTSGFLDKHISSNELDFCLSLYNVCADVTRHVSPCDCRRVCATAAMRPHHTVSDHYSVIRKHHDSCHVFLEGESSSPAPHVKYKYKA